MATSQFQLVPVSAGDFRDKARKLAMNHEPHTVLGGESKRE